MRNVIHVAVASDQEYALPLAAMLASLTERLDPARSLVIHLLSDRLTGDFKDRLIRSVPAGRVEWNCIDVNIGDLVERGFATRPYGHISPVTYCRLLIPELLPNSVEKVLYLDCDLIVCDDIAPLWDMDIADVDLAAAPELDLAGRLILAESLILDYGAPGMAPKRPVFNVGVMLINLVRWREKRISERAFDCLRRMGPDIRWYEQDALNLVINGDFRELEPRWNARPLPRRGPSAAPPVISIIHYFTAQKPWQWDYHWSHREEFFRSVDRTAWAGWRPEHPRFAFARLILERLIRIVLKGQQKMMRLGRLLNRRYRYHLHRSPRMLGARSQIPEPGDGEIRLFLTLPPERAAGDHSALLMSFREASVDRAFVVESSHLGAPSERESFGFPVHWFHCNSSQSAQALRHLLDRYGTGCWCVVGSLEVLRGENGCLINFREWCTRLEREGLEAGEAQTSCAPASRIELIGRDLRSGQLFRSTALVERPERAWDPPAFRSRLVVLKYRESMLLDPALCLVGNARRSERTLRTRSGT